ncbi:MAG TPA: transporter substrate-binding domain-containing protein [Acidimicrobiia bacterium]|nr:transporter substrate-binding domain-containing protein [Acidimicrobiia bacterium]
MVRRRLYIVLALSLVLAACGDGASDDTSTTAGGGETTTAPPAETTTTAAETTTTAADVCSTTSEALFEPGSLTIATGEPVFPPWMIDDDPTNGQGFESAVAYALAEELGFAAEDVNWVRTTFEEAIAPGERPYDFNMQQYGITEERDEIVDFSIPYYVEQKTVVALEGTAAASATTFAELAESNLGATIGTTDLDYIVEVIGVPDAEVAVYNDQAATFAALAAGQIDATVIGLSTAYFITAVEIDNAVISGVLPDVGGTEGGMGLLFTDGNPYVECVNAALQTLTDDGTLTALGDEWLEAGGDIPEITE